MSRLNFKIFKENRFVYQNVLDAIGSGLGAGVDVFKALGDLVSAGANAITFGVETLEDVVGFAKDGFLYAKDGVLQLVDNFEKPAEIDTGLPIYSEANRLFNPSLIESQAMVAANVTGIDEMAQIFKWQVYLNYVELKVGWVQDFYSDAISAIQTAKGMSESILKYREKNKEEYEKKKAEHDRQEKLIENGYYTMNPSAKIGAKQRLAAMKSELHIYNEKTSLERELPVINVEQVEFPPPGHPVEYRTRIVISESEKQKYNIHDYMKILNDHLNLNGYSTEMNVLGAEAKKLAGWRDRQYEKLRERYKAKGNEPMLKKLPGHFDFAKSLARGVASQKSVKYDPKENVKLGTLKPHPHLAPSVGGEVDDSRYIDPDHYLKPNSAMSPNKKIKYIDPADYL